MLNICRRRRSKIVSQRTGDGFALKIAKIRRLRNALIHSRLRNMALRPCPDGFAKKPISASDIGYIGSRLSPFHAAKCTISECEKAHFAKSSAVGRSASCSRWGDMGLFAACRFSGLRKMKC